MKRETAILLCLFVTCGLFASCNRGDKPDDGVFKIVTTSFVAANWIKNLLPGDSGIYEITVLCDDGKDMHNFQPSAKDMKEIYSAGLLVYIGGESDKWVDGIQCGDGAPVRLRLIDNIKGAHFEEHEGHGHDEAPDEHIWLSFENTLRCIEVLNKTLCELLPDQAKACSLAYEEYVGEINEVYDNYKSAVETAKYKAVVFADRFPFVYLMNELGIEYYAAFPGCSSETTASFSTVITLAQKIDELFLPCVLTIDGSADAIAETVIENTEKKNARILSINSMQVYRSDESFDYIDVMRENLEILKIALDCE